MRLRTIPITSSMPAAAILACVRRNDALNKEFRREGWPPYDTRFGLHVGDAVVGNIGSSDRMNYTALGATINLASRLEGPEQELWHARAGQRGRARARRTRFPVPQRRQHQAEGICGSRSRSANCAASVAQADEAEITMCRRWDEIYRLDRAGGRGRRRWSVSRASCSIIPEDGIAQYHAAAVSRHGAGSREKRHERPRSSAGGDC